MQTPRVQSTPKPPAAAPVPAPAPVAGGWVPVTELGKQDDLSTWHTSQPSRLFSAGTSGEHKPVVPHEDLVSPALAVLGAAALALTAARVLVCSRARFHVDVAEVCSRAGSEEER